ncbi:HD domain-containing protein [Rubrobacter marinus]|uniref:HD domain-containing protein n=1 Tax=Rubrobacter marinus TaxID=2653852 RepID=A0A6G8Q247_9ACTN|nr:HD domain-containing protein [Rubrobacter marinus]QIN80529.1 HD domain-containing protein [Rubrobacter marinus]
METGHGAVEDGTVKLSEVLSALSYVLDMVEGQPAGHVLRSCFIGMKVAERLQLTEEERSALFYALLLKDAGCSSNSSKVAALFESDDFRAKKALKTSNWSRLPRAVVYVARTVSPEGSVWSKARRFLAVGMEGPKAARNLVEIRCERGADISRSMGFPEETARAIRALDEHWNGAGHPDGLKGEEIPLLARICGLAQTVEVFYTAYGPTSAEEMARTRRGEWFDPALVDVFLAEARAGGLWGALGEPDLARSISLMEPADRVIAATPEWLDLTAHAFARIIDAKSPFTYRHSEGVARAAAKIGGHVGLSEGKVRDLKRAGLLHDIGKLGVSNRILDKPGRLTSDEFARVKRHPGLTYEVLTRVAPFRDIADTAANHHEKLDGSGYHRGFAGEHLSRCDRILAVADIFDALSQDRPYREAMPMERVLEIIGRESGEKLSPESVKALGELVSKGEL